MAAGPGSQAYTTSVCSELIDGGSHPTRRWQLASLDVVVRCTAKALKLLGLRPGELPELESSDDDWYLNLLWFERRKCLLLTHASTAFSVFVPDMRKRDLDPLGPFLTAVITQTLDAEQLPHDALGPLDPGDVQVAKTASRRVLGLMNDITVHLDHMLYEHGGLMDIDAIRINRQLQRTLHSHGRNYAQPIDLVRERGG